MCVCMFVCVCVREREWEGGMEEELISFFELKLYHKSCFVALGTILNWGLHQLPKNLLIQEKIFFFG